MNLSLTIALLFLVVVLSALSVFVGAGFVRRLPRRWHWALLLGVLGCYAILLFLRLPLLSLSNLIVLAVATTTSVILGHSLADPRNIISFSLAAAIADILSFTLGPTRGLIDRFGGPTGTLIHYLAITIRLGERVVPVLGLGDLIIAGYCFLGCAN